MAPRFVEQPVQVLQHSNPHRPLPFGFSAGASVGRVFPSWGSRVEEFWNGTQRHWNWSAAVLEWPDFQNATVSWAAAPKPPDAAVQLVLVAIFLGFFRYLAVGFHRRYILKHYAHAKHL